MTTVPHARKMFSIGRATVLEAKSPLADCAVVFEDDGSTGYLYAAETAPNFRIVDTLHIYNVEQGNAGRVTTVRIFWSADGLKALLSIDDHPHAIVDFKAQHAYCRTGFPPKVGDWNRRGHSWSDDALNLFD